MRSKAAVDIPANLESVPKDSLMAEAMSDEDYVDEYEHFNYDYDKHIFTGHSGKQRSKREAASHTNHFDPCGHSRKILTKLMNSEHNKRHQGKTKA